ncbi:hypothetical protein LTR66_005046 [Elasticomyces elasticus]|nr:hypothetical protein LTR66_005046 [Elasticomyces elasticus]
MLSWITGARPGNASSDPDATNYVEPPETPAPVFAVRAFKHAIFGTPQPVDAKQADRVLHILDTDREPETADDVAETITKQKIHVGIAGVKCTMPSDQVGFASPTKPNGILMTPGTGTTRRKTVTFGAHVVDNEGKKSIVPGRSGLPATCPGKFPSPWTPKAEDVSITKAADNGKGRSKLTAALYEVRDSASKSKARAKARAKDDADLTIDLNEPRSQSGKYWKQEYESHAERTKQETKKLLTKQKVAKNFARLKDTENTKLIEQLRQEKRKAEKLEMRSNELATQMKDYQEKLRLAMAEELRSSMENGALKQRLAALEEALAKTDQTTASVPAGWQHQQRKVVQDLRAARDEASSLRTEKQHLVDELEKARVQVKLLKSRAKGKSDALRPSIDIWAQAVDSSLVPEEDTNVLATEQPYASSSKRKRIPTDVPPLSSRQTNIMPVSPSRREVFGDGVQQIIATPQRAFTSAKRSGPSTKADSRHQRPNSLDLSAVALPLLSPELPYTPPIVHSALRDRPTNMQSPTGSVQVSALSLPSGTFKTDPPVYPIQAAPPVQTTRRGLDSALPAPAKGAPRSTQESHAVRLVDASFTQDNNIPQENAAEKENVAPTAAAELEPDKKNLRVVPTQQVSVDHSASGKRAASLSTREKRQLDPERVSEAKARLEAKRHGRLMRAV